MSRRNSEHICAVFKESFSRGKKFDAKSNAKARGEAVRYHGSLAICWFRRMELKDPIFGGLHP